MTLTPEQKQAVTSWVAAGDNLSTVQQKLREQFQLSMTYMDVRFLVDDLNLELKDPKPASKSNDLARTPPTSSAGDEGGAKKGFLDKVKEKVGLGAKDGGDEMESDLAAEEDLEADDIPAGADAGISTVKVVVDKVTLIPGALAGGSVTFSDGVTGKWIVDQYGRPGFTEISKPGYRPTAADAQAFMRELSAELQKRGF
ncbi:MAG TPA: hypothetical protein VMC06_13165 [Opitutaceae bacterium]|nr:hypothetical protein [Opitutaceae bacterium]